MVTISHETILNEKVGYHFCQVILLFWLRQKVVPCTKYKMKSRIMNAFYRKLSRPQEKWQMTPTGAPIPGCKLLIYGNRRTIVGTTTD